VPAAECSTGVHISSGGTVPAAELARSPAIHISSCGTVPAASLSVRAALRSLYVPTELIAPPAAQYSQNPPDGREVVAHPMGTHQMGCAQGRTNRRGQSYPRHR